MARFNPQKVTVNRTVNRAGGEAFVQDEKLRLVSLMLTSFVQDQYYRSADQQLKELQALVENLKDKKFAAQATIFARREFGMRSISHAAAVGVVNAVKGEEWVKWFVYELTKAKTPDGKPNARPDDITEIMAYHAMKHGRRPIPNSLKKGLAMSLPTYDEYQLAKYQGKGKAYSLVDVVNLVHPPHNTPLSKLVNGTLEPPKTWEVGLTQAGQQAGSDEDKAERKAQVWGELIRTRKLGYTALLRNLRNILQQAPETLGDALEMLRDETLISRARVLPFQYLTAIEALRSENASRDVIAALHDALEISVSNVPKFPGRSAVIIDDSGSMRGRPLETAAIFGAVLYKSNNADLVRFSNDAEYINANPRDSVLTIARSIMANAKLAGTNFSAALELFTRSNARYERLIYLSDMQGWIGYNVPTGPLARYEQMAGHRPHIYSLDLQGYGDMQFPQDRVYCLAGFSEKIFDVMGLLEQDKQALVRRIEQVTF